MTTSPEALYRILTHAGVEFGIVDGMGKYKAPPQLKRHHELREAMRPHYLGLMDILRRLESRS